MSVTRHTSNENVGCDRSFVVSNCCCRLIGVVLRLVVSIFFVSFVVRLLVIEMIHE